MSHRNCSQPITLANKRTKKNSIAFLSLYMFNAFQTIANAWQSSLFFLHLLRQCLCVRILFFFFIVNFFCRWFSLELGGSISKLQLYVWFGKTVSAGKSVDFEMWIGVQLSCVFCAYACHALTCAKRTIFRLTNSTWSRTVRVSAMLLTWLWIGSSFGDDAWACAYLYERQINCPCCCWCCFFIHLTSISLSLPL